MTTTKTVLFLSCVSKLKNELEGKETWEAWVSHIHIHTRKPYANHLKIIGNIGGHNEAHENYVNTIGKLMDIHGQTEGAYKKTIRKLS